MLRIVKLSNDPALDLTRTAFCRRPRRLRSNLPFALDRKLSPKFPLLPVQILVARVEQCVLVFNPRTVAKGDFSIFTIRL